jgi:hypothetical protein
VPGSAGTRQGILLRTGFFRLDWTLRFTQTTVVIDERSYHLPWGEQFFPLEEGSHLLHVWYRYLHLDQAGKASIRVEVPRGQAVKVSYQPPTSVLLARKPGALRVESPAQPH